MRRGIVDALIVAALDLETGQTTLFAEVGPDIEYKLVFASASQLACLPMILAGPDTRPTGGNSTVSAGGLRFNTPMAPAMRVGAERLVVVSLLHEDDPERRIPNPSPTGGPAQYPGLVFLAGKILNALLLDRVAYDLHVLARFNVLIEVLQKTLSPSELARVDSVVAATRGMPYSLVQPLVFAPSEDIGCLAGERVRRLLGESGAGRVLRWMLTKVAMPAQGPWEADWASYLLFDGPFCRQLIELGLEDVRRRADAVREFFAS